LAGVGGRDQWLSRFPSTFANALSKRSGVEYRGAERRRISVSLACHKRPRARELIETVGGRLTFLPPYSPDFNPIEMLFAKLKAPLRKASELR